MKRRLYTVVLWGVLWAAPTIYAEEGYGRLGGQVLDAQSGQAVSGASVALLEDPVFFVRTDLNGRYAFQDVPAGTYTIRVFKGGYEPYDVTGVGVDSETTAKVNIPLPRRQEAETAGETPAEEAYAAPEETALTADDSDIFEMAAFEVTAEIIRSTEATLLASRQRSTSLSDAIGGETFSRLSLGDAAEAMTKVTGASVVDGKYVFIRGLGDRYSNPLLNGASIPSADPDKRSVQMDQFPSDLLESIVTSKSFTPDQPGSFSGGSVNVKTKSFPEHFFVTLGASAEYNSQTTGKDIYVTEQGVNWNARGIDDRPRTMVDPDDIPQLSGRGSNTATGAALQGDLSVAERLDAITKEFPRHFYPSTESALPAYGGSLSFGDTLEFENSSKLGYTVSFTWDHDYSHYEDGIETRWQTPEEFKYNAQVYTTDPEILDRMYWYTNYYGNYADPYGGGIPFGVTKSTQSVNWGAFGKVAYLPGEHHELSLTLFHNQSAEDEVKHGVGDGFSGPSSPTGRYLWACPEKPYRSPAFAPKSQAWVNKVLGSGNSLVTTITFQIGMV